jgi:hypothetical protein
VPTRVSASRSAPLSIFETPRSPNFEEGGGQTAGVGAGANFDVEVAGEEDVVSLDVAVDDVAVVKILQRLEEVNKSLKLTAGGGGVVTRESSNRSDQSWCS